MIRLERYRGSQIRPYTAIEGFLCVLTTLVLVGFIIFVINY